METTFTAPGISCQGCANTIEKALGNIPDVSGVSVDVAKKTRDGESRRSRRTTDARGRTCPRRLPRGVERARPPSPPAR